MSLFGPVFDWFTDKETDWAHSISGVATAAQKRMQQQAMNDQIKAYKDQTELTRKELASKKDQAISEKRRVEEKQIRALRRNYRSQGFLGGEASTQTDMNNQLGG